MTKMKKRRLRTIVLGLLATCVTAFCLTFPTQGEGARAEETPPTETTAVDTKKAHDDCFGADPDHGGAIPLTKELFESGDYTVANRLVGEKYYLTGNITVTKAVSFYNATYDTMNLCLNGYSITYVNPTSAAGCITLTSHNVNAVLRLFDCCGTDTEDPDRIHEIPDPTADDAPVTIRGGLITSPDRGIQRDALVRVSTYQIHVEMYGGTIAGAKTTLDENPNINTGRGGGVNGNLTLYGGEISHNYAYVGGGIYTGSDQSIIKVFGGAVKNNVALRGGGGIFVFKSLLMSGGEVSGNTAKELWGGGILANGTSVSLTITGGKIFGNTAAVRGGGIQTSGAVLRLTGGEIYGNNVSGDSPSEYYPNVTEGGGINTTSNQGLKLSGSPVIRDNFARGTRQGDVYVKGESGTPDNVFLGSGATNSIAVDGALTEGAEIWVSPRIDSKENSATHEIEKTLYPNFASGYAAGGEGDTAYVNAADPNQYFHSDDSHYFIAPTAEGGLFFADTLEAAYDAGDTAIRVTDALDSLKQYFTVQASVSRTIFVVGTRPVGTITEYTLSLPEAQNGVLIGGENTVTVKFGGKETEITVADVLKESIAKPAADTTKFVYTGNEQTYAVAVNEGYTVTGAAQTGAGTYTVAVALKDKTRTEWADGTDADLTFEFAIAKASITKPAADTTKFVYTGSEQTYTVAVNESYTVTGAAQTDVGTYTVTVALKDKKNVEWADGTDADLTFEFVIAKASIAKPAADTTKFTYTGKDQTYAVAADEGYSVTGAVQKDAGTYAVTIALKDKENYTWSDDSDGDLTYSFVIEKAPNMVNGLILEGWKQGETPSLPSASAADGAITYLYAASEDGEYSATVPAEAGTYWVKAMVAETANYKAAESKPISFVIAAQTKPETGLSGGALAGIIIAGAIVAIALALFALFIFRKDKSIGFSDFYKKLWKRIVKGRTESIKEAEFPAEENEIDEDDKRE